MRSQQVIGVRHVALARDRAACFKREAVASHESPFFARYNMPQRTSGAPLRAPLGPCGGRSAAAPSRSSWVIALLALLAVACGPAGGQGEAGQPIESGDASDQEDPDDGSAELDASEPPTCAVQDVSADGADDLAEPNPVDELDAGEAEDAAASAWPLLEPSLFGVPALITDTLTLAEGPVWDPCTQTLLFNDVEARTIYQFTPGGSIGVYFEPTNYANGLAFDADGNLLMAEMGGGQGGRITRMDRAMNIEVLIDHDPSCNKLNTTDDLALRSDGTLYFTDPVVAHGGWFGFGLFPKPIYRLKRGEGPRTIVSEATANLPNGIRLSPDESLLYAVGYLDGQVFRFRVTESGALTDRTVFAGGLSSPDSLCVDVAGNVYVGVRQGLQILRSDGSQAALLPIDSPSGTTNCAFSGEDGKTLFITAWTSLWQLDDVPIAGNDWQVNRSMRCD